ncbi:hypothetical protein MKX47_21380 [Solibacillus sp. FSL R7-0668]|uniref:hypothetical protein n=1 Tax=Solibacillus sp. FSL R7-0668 TaxID=2921688 RepID=UPI0030F559DB
MKKIRLIVFGVLLVSFLFVISNNNSVFAADLNDVENELVENSDETSLAAACVSPKFIYYHKNSGTKEVTFIVQGNPGSSITFYIYKYLGGLYLGTHTTLDSTGYKVLTYTVENGSYEAVLGQSGTCSGTYGPEFFTMN